MKPHHSSLPLVLLSHLDHAEMGDGPHGHALAHLGARHIGIPVTLREAVAYPEGVAE